ncbi:MAG: protein kinase [Vicinamibacterales bacterium]
MPKANGIEKAKFHDLAAAVADGRAVDWKGLAGESSEPGRQRLVEQFRVIASIASAHSVDSESGDPGDGPPPGPASTPATTRGSHRVTGKPAAHEPGELGHWGDLILIEEVGQGSFGTVYRAHDPQLDRAVAVKLLHRTSSNDEQLASRLVNEGQTLARVRHPNVVTVYGAGKYDGRVGLWMEFVRGKTLEQMLAAHGPFSPGEAGLVGHELCGALAAVHFAGLVHRDVKAQNVMREEGGRLVLVDFGAGQRRNDLGTIGGRIVGTPLYLAPEVLAGSPATTRSDVYSLGVLLYHLVTDDFPVKATNFDGLVLAHACGEITPLQDARPTLPKTFVRVVERAINPNPDKRYESAGRLQAALAQIPGAGRNKTVAPRLRPATGKEKSAAASVRVGGLDVPSVAVLPFSDMSPAKDQDCFCDGMTEELINALTQIPGLRVAARTSAFQFKGQSRDVRRIGDSLNVATVLDGSVRKEGNRLRITIELIGAADGFHLWSRRFDRSVEEVFTVQDEIAESIVAALKGQPDSDARVSAPAPRSRDFEAYEAYLEGRYRWNKRTEEELKKSVACFERSIARDPDFAPAHAGMADAYVTLGTYGCLAAKEVMPPATTAIERALAINPELAQAHASRACVRAVYDWAWSDAERDFRRAIALAPYPTAHHWFAINHLVPVGRFDEAARELRYALELDPLALAIKTSVGMNSYFAGEYDAAVRELSKTLELDEGFGMAHFVLGATYTEMSRYADAFVELAAAVSLSGRSPEILAAVGYLHGMSGDVDAARDILDEMSRLARERYVSPARLAQVHVALGERAEALDRLEAAHAERAADLAWLGVRPVFASLRREPRFGAMLSQMGLARS